MKCPVCQEDSAFLWNEDGLCAPGRGIRVEIKCGGECAKNINGPVHIGELTIDIVIKRGSIVIDA